MTFSKDTAQEETYKEPEEYKKSRQDLLSIIDGLQNDGQKSKFMLGHISKAVIEDQFLMESENKLIDSSLAINCKEHNRPAVFFSAKSNSWRCF